MVAKRNRWFRASLISLAVASGAPALLAESKIAVVDSARALTQVEDGLRAQATLNKAFDGPRKDLDKREKELQAERADLEKQRGVISQEALMQRAEKWQQAAAAAQQLFSDLQRDSQKKQAELLEPIRDQLARVIQRIATESGYTVVLEKQVTAYVQADLDVTDQVIAAYNLLSSKSVPASKPAGKPAAPKPTPAKPAAAKSAPAAAATPGK